MISYRESEYQPDRIVREHPYTDGTYDQRVKYYDFRTNPAAIRQSLEDFKPWEPRGAIETFYQLLEWLNGEMSELESNDCAFHGPQPNISVSTSPKELECKGRLMIFWRRLELNVSEPHLKWLIDAAEHYLKHTDESTWLDGVIGLSFMETAFGRLNKNVGKEMVLQFWAFGDSEDELFENLDRLFKNLTMALKGLSNEVQQSISREVQQSKAGSGA
jgi:hypothetical protein